MSIETTIYHPYTQAEYLELKETFEKNVTNYLPDHLAGWAWNNYKLISGSRENQPCNCGSSAGLWRKAVETIRGFINKIEGV